MTDKPQVAAGLRILADLIDAHELHDDVRYALDTLYVPVDGADDPRGRMAAWARAAIAAGLTVRKVYDDRWGFVDIDLPGVIVHVYADRERVCERIVTGTREVRREVVIPVETRTETVIEVVEDVEWRCAPLLAPSADSIDAALDTTSSVSRQHYVDTGEYLPEQVSA